MELADAISLIRSPIIPLSVPTRWADLGAGSGLFTLALAHFLCVGSKIYAVDKKPQSPLFDLPAGISLESLPLDFVGNPLPFRDLDGILMANSLHYVKDKPSFIEKIKGVLKQSGTIIIVEYDTDKPVGNWVPYPVNFSALGPIFKTAGFAGIERLREMHSVYGSMMYSAIISQHAGNRYLG